MSQQLQDLLVFLVGAYVFILFLNTGVPALVNLFMRHAHRRKEKAMIRESVRFLNQWNRHEQEQYVHREPIDRKAEDKQRWSKVEFDQQFHGGPKR